jgi:hypothetical protein
MERVSEKAVVFLFWNTIEPKAQQQILNTSSCLLNDGTSGVALLCGNVVEQPQLLAETIVEREGVPDDRACAWRTVKS